MPPLAQPSGSPANADGAAFVPAPRAPLVGREREIAAAQAMLLRPDVRLLTLTGPGGVGKTRLALALVPAAAPRFRDGVRFVPLAPLRDANHVASAIAQALGVRDAGERRLEEGLALALGQRELLLVLDNFEHVGAAAPLIAGLLDACPRLEVLVTSRVSLHVYGEHEHPVPALDLPQSGSFPDASTAAGFAAVRLFVERAQAVKPDFALNDANAAAVVEICRRLDGLPLAIELAAAWSKTLPPAGLLRRLKPRLPLLTGGPRDQPPRLRTMHDAIAWSYDLLTLEEQALFRRLAVFAGGFTLEGVEAMEPVGSEVLPLIAALVDKNLLRRRGEAAGEPRFSMLETVREFALGQLAAHGETDAARSAHLAWCIALAEAAEPHLNSGARIPWLRRLDGEHDNLRAALAWGRTSAAASSLAVRLAGALRLFWFYRGHWNEGRAWLEAMLPLAGGDCEAARIARARLHFGIGHLAWVQSDFPIARAHLLHCIALRREVGDPLDLGYALGFLSAVVRGQGDNDLAAALADEFLPIFESGSDRWGLAFARIAAGNVEWARGADERAARLYESGIAILREVGDTWLLSLPLRYLARQALHRGDLRRAAALQRESLACLQEPEERWFLSQSFIDLAVVAAAQGDHRRAVRLGGASEALREAIGAPIHPTVVAEYEQAVARARTALGDEAFAANWEEGRRRPLAETILEALTDEPHATSTLPKGGGDQSGLTPREREVLRLLAAGHTDRESAAILFISPRTVETHVTNILNKLRLPSRLALVVYAARHGLV